MRADIKLKSMKEPVNAHIQQDVRRPGMLKATYLKVTKENRSMVTLVGEKYQEMLQEAISN